MRQRQLVDQKLRRMFGRSGVDQVDCFRLFVKPKTDETTMRDCGNNLQRYSELQEW